MKKRWIFLFLIGFMVVFIRGFKDIETKYELKKERERMAHLDVSALDLTYLVNKVDELGGDFNQLNWKEIIAFIGVEQNNEMHQISDEVLTYTAQEFMTDTHVKSFDEVVADSDFSDDEKTRAYQYLDDLKYVGYVSSKLEPSAKEAQFIAQLVQPAEANYYETGILPSITIAQAILESNWGTSDLAVATHNLFGIKADSRWDGPSMSFETLEYADQMVIGTFRQYENWQQSIDDHAAFLVNNARYQQAGVFEAKTYRLQAKALQDAGYSTAEDELGNRVYAKRLGELIRQYNLQLYDHEVMYDAS